MATLRLDRAQRLLIFAAGAMWLAFAALAAKRDYADAWILDGILAPFLGFCVISAAMMLLERSNAVIAAMSAVFVSLTSLLPALKYGQPYGVTIDSVQHYLLVKSLIETGHVLPTHTYAAISGEHSWLALLGLATGLPAATVVAVGPALHASTLVFLIYWLCRESGVQDHVTRLVLLLGCLAWPPGYELNGTIFSIGPLVMVVGAIILRSFYSRTRGRKWAYSAIALLGIVQLVLWHSTTPLLLPLVLVAVSLTPVAASLVRGGRPSFRPAWDIVGFAGLSAVLFIGYHWLVSDRVWQVMVQRLGALIAGEGSSTAVIPARFFEVSLMAKVTVVLVLHGRDLVLGALMGLGLLLMIGEVRRRSSQSEMLLALALAAAVYCPLVIVPIPGADYRRFTWVPLVLSPFFGALALHWLETGCGRRSSWLTLWGGRRRVSRQKPGSQMGSRPIPDEGGMVRDDLEAPWHEEAARVINGLREWRLGHPRATFGEIEQALDERLGRMHARLLQDVAMGSAAAELLTAETGERVHCPQCDAILEDRGVQERRLMTHHEQVVRLKRHKGVCPACGESFFPLDEELALLPGVLTPSLQEDLVRLGVWLPYGRAVQELAHFRHTLVSRRTAARLTAIRRRVSRQKSGSWLGWLSISDQGGVSQDSLGAGWHEEAARVISGLKEWRLGHPRATFGEIEQALDERLGKMRARLLQDVAMGSAAAELLTPETEERVHCPQCDAVLEDRGVRERRLRTRQGQVVRLKRHKGVCPVCGAGFFPLDEELALLPGALTPSLQEDLVRLSIWLSYGRAVQELAHFRHTLVSRRTAARLTSAAGAAYVALQAAEAARLGREAPQASVAPARLFLSVGTVMLPLVGGESGEVKTLAVGEVQPLVLGNGERVLHMRQHSYFSRLAKAETFQRLALVETDRRGIGLASAVGALTDGSEWAQTFLDHHCCQATRILDLSHAVEHLDAIGQAYWGVGSREAQEWLSGQVQALKHAGPTAVLAEVRRLVALEGSPEDSASHLVFLENCEAQMQYPTFLAAGWPIGDGTVDRANKQVVEARLKGRGMHWSRSNVDPMLALRNIVCSDRWDEAWPQIALALRHRARQRQAARRHQSLAVGGSAPGQLTAPLQSTPATLPAPSAATASSGVLAPSLTAPPARTRPGQPQRLSASHLWQCMLIARALFRPPIRYPDARPRIALVLGRSAVVLVIVGLVGLLTIQNFLCQPIVPQYADVNINSRDYLLWIQEANSAQQTRMLAFAESMTPPQQRFAADLWGRQQFLRYFGLEAAGRRGMAAPLQWNIPLDSIRASFFLLHWPGPAGGFGEQLERRSADVIAALRERPGWGVVYDNGGSFVLSLGPTETAPAISGEADVMRSGVP